METENIAEIGHNAGVALPQKRRQRPEWALQVQIKKFVREYVACQHEFVAHDRSQNVSGKQHMFEAARGIRKGWPDTELLWEGGRSFRCEMKWAPNKVRPDDDQGRLILRLNALGHPTRWVTSVHQYWSEAAAIGVPFHLGAEKRASYFDEMLLARHIARKRVGPSKPRAPTPTKRALKFGTSSQQP
jgi:hypothetical protein